MVADIKLYINDSLVEFTSDPNVLYTYQTTDMSNPTAVKNSFSKQIQLDGTPTNNDIFGHYWDVSRYIYNGGNSGAAYNSSKKATFQLFMGSDLYEEGYCKLDSIQKEGSMIKYNISLYGGLGDFFWNLSATDDGTEKKLSDLDYTEEGGSDEFDFVANIDSVNTAWGVLGGTVNPNFSNNKKWSHINFCPAYNGKPSDFNANKIIINTSGTTLQYGAKNADDDKWYYTKNRWTIGTLPDEMTEWEVRDLRSYLQRPCIKMSSIINACCNPNNNGGYEVDLDPDFFTQENEFWSKTWLTLPMVQNLEYNGEEQILDGATLLTSTTTGDTNGLMYQNLRFDLGNINSNVSNITLKTQINLQTGYPYSSFIWFWNWNGNSAHPNYVCYGSLFVQLIALNGDTVVGASQVYNLTTPIRHNGNLYYGHNGHYPESTGYDSQTGRRKMGDGSQYIPYMDMPIYSVLGKFGPSGFKAETGHTSSSSTYSDTPYEFTFNITNMNSNVTGLKMVFYWGASEKMVKHFSPGSMFGTTYDNGWVGVEYSRQSTLASGLTLNITDHNLSAVLGESLGRTGTKVTKALLLNTKSSPCDYLLSYCKMFGLHFLKDVGEKRIHIMTRKTFYDRTDVVDLEQYIDRSRPSEITPIMFKSKWYQFLQEKDETSLQQKYLTTKGVEYGCKVLDTGYEFNADKIDLLKDNCIKSGIECVEKSKYFTAYNNDNVLRPWMNLGLKYTLWNGEDTFEFNAGVGNTGTIMPINEGQGLKYYDIFPKLQFHGDNNDPTDGNNCLVFFSGFKSTSAGRANPLTYILSDDTAYQTDLNDGTPCWLFTPHEVVGGKRLCYKLGRIPVFERYLTGAESGTIQKSLDFGSAQELYVPNYNLTDDTNIFHSYWRTYLEDLFDANTKQMTCYIRVVGKPNPEWFRRFYWFDNSIFILNKLADWNIASHGTTKAEFIKVQNISSYTSVSQEVMGGISITPNITTIDATGGTVTLTITTDFGVEWRLGVEGGSNVTLSSTGGTGTMNVTATFAPNTEDYQVGAYFTATRNDNAYAARCYVHQYNADYKSVKPIPEDIIVPASGGSVTIDLQWINQGSSYIYDVDWRTSGDGGWDFDVDYVTYRSENKVVFTFPAYTGDTVRHNYCTMCDYYHDACCSIGIDQLPASYAFVGSGGTQVLNTLYAENATFVEIPYWIATEPTGSSFNMVAEQNPTNEHRMGVVRMELNGTYADFEVEQRSATEFSVTRVDGTGSVLAAGGTISLEVISDGSWTISDYSNWSVPQTMSGSTSATINVVVSQNDDEARKGTIIFQHSGGTYYYTVSQNGINTDNFVDPVALIFPGTGGTNVFSINTTDTWRIVGKPGWISVSTTGGTGSATVTVTADTNMGYDRSGSIVIEDQTKSRTYVVSVMQQTGDVFMVARVNGSGDIPATGGLCYLEVTSPNKAWTASTTDSFISLDKTGWSASTGLYVTFTSNTSTNRVATINFVDALGQTLTYTQSQAGSNASGGWVNPGYVDFTASGGTAETQTVTVNTTDPWQVVARPGWVTITPSSGTGVTTVSIVANPYSGTEARTGTIVFYDTTTMGTALVITNQEAPQGEMLAVSPSALRFDASGGTKTLTIISNTDWTIG